MDLFDLSAKIKLDTSDYDRSLQNASSAAEQWATKFVMASKAIGSAIGTVSRQIFGLTQQAVGSFSSFEQLKGGVETLFGTQGKSFEDWSKTFEQSSDKMQDYIDVARKVINGEFGTGSDRKDLLAQAGYDPETVQQMVNNLINGIDVSSNISADKISANMQTAEEKYESLQRAQDLVMENAWKAYETAGLSVNDYLKTVTGFSASLLQGLDGDTEKAAEYADRALRDMSDNANKMGTSMESIQYAYQGFAKQNYTMLDNLKLGYGGTKTEMERLIKDAAQLTDVQDKLGVTVDANSMSFDNIINAISVMQDHMGIAGTTTQEAATTIEGSTKMMKAAWSNMLTAMVTGGEKFDESLNALITSVKTYTKNIVPAFQGALKGFAALVSGIAPIIMQELPGMAEEILPGFIEAIETIINSILDAMPSLLETLTNVLPMISTAISNLIPSLIHFILEGIPALANAGMILLESLVSGLADNVDTVIPLLSQGLIDMFDHLADIFTGSGTNIASAGLALLTGLANALVDAVPSVLTQITQMLQDLTASIKTVAEGDEGGNILSSALAILKQFASDLGSSVAEVLPELTLAFSEFVSTFAGLAGENTKDLINGAFEILKTLADNLAPAVPKVMTNLTDGAMAVIDAIVDVITGLDIKTFADACVSIVTALADGIVGAVGVITEKLPDLITKLVAWLTDPNNLLEMGSAALDIFGAIVSDVPKIIASLTTCLADIVTGIANYFRTNGGDITEGLIDAFGGLKDKVVTIWEEKIKPAFDELGEFFKNFFLQFEWGETFFNFVKNIGDKIGELWNNVKSVFDGEDGFFGKVKAWFAEFDLTSIVDGMINGMKTAFSTGWDNLKPIVDGADGLLSKIKTWFSGLDLTEAVTAFIDNLKSKIDGAWEAFTSWLGSKFTGAVNSIVSWFTGGNRDNGGSSETEGTENAEGEEGSIDMPSNMVTLDYNNLQPIPDEVIESYQALAVAIDQINTAITGGGEEGASEMGETGEGAVGLSAALAQIPALLDAILISAQALGAYFSGDFLIAIQELLKALYIGGSEDKKKEEKKQEGGNTLANALGEIKGLFESILGTTEDLIGIWKGAFIEAINVLKSAIGDAIGTVEDFTSKGLDMATAYQSAAAAVLALVAALEELSGVGGGSGAGGGTPQPSFVGAAAGGAEVKAGETFMVGENGPELFTAARSGTIIPNNRLGGNVTINLTFAGDVFGDEQSISDYVVTATRQVIEQEVFASA